MNHQSTLDLLLLGYVIPSRSVFTAKKEIASIPIMGQVFVAGNNILIDRGNRTSAVEAMNKVGERMKKDNLSVMIFPEGTRSNQRDNTLLPFKKGAFHLAKQTGFPIVPIVASTYFPIYDEKSMKFEQGTFAIKGLCVVLTPVLPPILTNGPDVTVDGLIAQTHKAMEDALQSISSVPKDQYA
ncbi:1-acylglycerol-3-phosphate O-acyltransferase [Kappamyces sp. JEL0680]|nr:1-acylglycerol-3-phosphate O-acyltransferase [Kappamyces sp. JEL0680]